MRIFIGMYEIAGFFTNLEDGLQRLGYQTQFVNIKDVYGYHQSRDDEPWIIRYHRSVLTKHHNSKRQQVFRWAISKMALAVTSLLMFLWAVPRFDVFIFSSRLSFFRACYDLPLLRLLGKKIIFVFHGTDARPAYINAARMHMGLTTTAAIQESKRTKRQIDRICRFSDSLVSDPPFSHFFTASPLALTFIGKAVSDKLPDVETVTEGNTGTARILHIPSKKSVKGTDEIERIVQGLIDKGYPIEFEAISGVPNIQVKQALSRCDFIIDNVYTDTTIGVIGAEAAQYGKPAVIGGYVWDELHRFIPEDRFTPAERCHPDEMEAAIIKLIENPDYRKNLGQRAKAWVESNWMPEQVAEKMLLLIHGEAPLEWYFDPNDIRYFHGHGLSDEKARYYVKQVIELGGVKALQLHDKPHLEKLAIAFAEGKEL